ncbi:MAG: hypothetical protein ABI586_06720 [Candidatus Nanopelagicales bacterium]
MGAAFFATAWPDALVAAFVAVLLAGFAGAAFVGAAFFAAGLAGAGFFASLLVVTWPEPFAFALADVDVAFDGLAVDLAGALVVFDPAVFEADGFEAEVFDELDFEGDFLAVFVVTVALRVAAADVVVRARLIGASASSRDRSTAARCSSGAVLGLTDETAGEDPRSTAPESGDLHCSPRRHRRVRWPCYRLVVTRFFDGKYGALCI